MDFGKSHVCLLDMHTRATPAQSRGVRRAVWLHTHALTRAHTLEHTGTHTLSHTSVHTCTHTSVLTHTVSYLCAHTHCLIPVCTHALTRAHTHAHRYTHVHTHTMPTSSRVATLVSAHLHMYVTSLLPFCPRLCPPVQDPTSSGA